jgi:DNA processing protein
MGMREFSAEKLAKIRIARSGNVGPVTFRQMIFRHATAEEAVQNWQEFAKKSQPLCPEENVRGELDKILSAGGWVLVWGEEGYPPQLADLPDAPIVLSGLGEKKFLLQRQVAMVGNRSASAAGIAWGRGLASDLARAGIVVTSGLARGIDTAVHEGALQAGGGTVAVVAGGVDHVYPPENAALRKEIIGHGCVVSEQPWGSAPTASLFPRRNRIIAGLSMGVVVSEATRHSGSLITAECALNYGREVWAVPGSPGDLRSGGPNWLLKNGATLIETAADIMAHLPARAAPYVKNMLGQKDLFETEDDEAEEWEEMEGTVENPPLDKVVYALLGKVPVTFDELVRQCKISEAEVSVLLVGLELDGLAVREADGRWRRA